jgi:hypothetical protein
MLAPRETKALTEENFSMGPRVATILMCAGLTLVIGCSKKEDSSVTTTASTSTGATATATTATPAATAAATAAPAAAAADVSPEMKGFMAMLDGKDDSAGKALKKYAAKGKEKDDLGMYTLKDPKVTKTEKVGANTCYTMESKAGMMDHTTKLCWDAKGKIVEIADTSK